MRSGMSALQEDADVQLSGIRCLERLAFNANNHVVIATESVRSVLAGIRAHPDQLDVQCSGFGALNSLAGNVRNKEVMVEELVAEMAVAVLRTHGCNLHLVQRGCSLLAALAFKNPKVKASIVAAGGVEVVLSCMKQIPSDVMVQVAGCSVLRNLSAHSGK